jgi:hypothetical protein
MSDERIYKEAFDKAVAEGLTSKEARYAGFRAVLDSHAASKTEQKPARGMTVNG